ncbi:MAG: twin-arginine translocase subunit TatC [Anaerolineales bacterium]|nr:twin-arginine translocase subunit TatC [Anaerolineales bacterium]
MRRIFKSLSRALTFPFVLAYKIILFIVFLPVRAWEFLNSNPEDHPGKSFVAHVEELRTHLLWILVFMVAGVGASFYYTIPLMEYLARPVGGLAKLQAIEVTEELGVYMRVALTSGITITLPFTAYSVWRFAAFGLSAREKKYSLLAIPGATVLFAGGVAFTHSLLIPAALPFLGGFTEIAQFWTAKEYFGFVTGLMLWIGLFSETPLVVFALTYLGFITPQTLVQQWRLAVVVIAVLAAAVTPTIDPVNMGLVMLPMTLLYFVSVGLSYVAAALRRNKEPKEEKASTKGKRTSRRGRTKSRRES